MAHPMYEPDDGQGRQLLSTAMAVTAIVAIVTVVIGPWRGGSTMSDAEGTGSSEVVAPPPAGEPGRAHVAVSPSSVPVGAEVALILVNPTGEDRSTGVAGTLQRWDGSHWSDHRRLTTGIGPDAPAGRLFPLDEDVIVPMVAFTAPPGGFAAPVWTRLEGVDAGWYRVVLGGASGIVQVGGEAARTLPRPATGIVFGGGGVLPAGQEGRLAFDTRRRDPRSGDFDPDRDVGEYTTRARVERYEGDRWVMVPSDTVLTIDSDVTADPGGAAWQLHLPVLEAGVYRVSREASVAARIEGLFWVLPLR
ncbi:hypothetical protein KIH74_04940 [Kineosporia sp. J2-2]|uniref:Uncharacterized protein n=1 Tax=Kineosporia corallincola TaxID=2835133 RepID=A0ABS5TB24_9ACTN|nr:hypothetical protein [Kineosporia corallincola]MBT0768256.1 hypothetical protein [Kineosporia corallincola]